MVIGGNGALRSRQTRVTNNAASLVRLCALLLCIVYSVHAYTVQFSVPASRSLFKPDHPSITLSTRFVPAGGPWAIRKTRVILANGRHSSQPLSVNSDNVVNDHMADVRTHAPPCSRHHRKRRERLNLSREASTCPQHRSTP